MTAARLEEIALPEFGMPTEQPVVPAATYAARVAAARDEPALVVGNERRGYAMISQVPVRTVLYQNFSLMGQDRTAGAGLADILAGEGVESGARHRVEAGGPAVFQYSRLPAPLPAQSQPGHDHEEGGMTAVRDPGSFARGVTARRRSRRAERSASCKLEYHCE